MSIAESVYHLNGSRESGAGSANFGLAKGLSAARCLVSSALEFAADGATHGQTAGFGQPGSQLCCHGPGAGLPEPIDRL